MSSWLVSLSPKDHLRFAFGTDLVLHDSVLFGMDHAFLVHEDYRSKSLSTAKLKSLKVSLVIAYCGFDNNLASTLR